jgi:hypothetical protein
MKLRKESGARLLGALLALLVIVCPVIAQTALPAGTVGGAYSYQVATVPAAPSGTVYGASGLPPGLSINVATGLISGNPTVAGSYNATVSLLAGGSTDNLAVTIAVNPPVGTLTITSGATATGTAFAVFTAYATTTSTVVGAPVTSFNLTGLPPGLVGNSTTGVITGTPTSVGVYPVAISANNLNGTGEVKTVTITIGAAVGAPLITSSAVYLATANVPAGYTITASNAPTSFTATGLPLGLSLNSATGVISGTPTVAGASVVALTATNAAGTSPVYNLTLTVGNVPVISSAVAANAGMGAAFSFALTASNSPVSYTTGGLPPGLALNNTTGAISGTPTATGIYPVAVSAANATGTGPVATLTLTVGSLPAITSAVAASGTVGSPFSYIATASNGATGFAVAGLPFGLSATALGTISGTPSSAGTSLVTLTATNLYGTGPATTLTLTIASAPVVPPVGPPPVGTPVAPAVTTQPVAQTVTAGDNAAFSVAATGTAPLLYQWKKDGLGLSGATASTLTLAAVKAADAGSYSVTVSNAAGFVSSSVVTLTVNPVVVVVVATAPVITRPPADQSVVPGGGASFAVVATGTAPLGYQWRRNGVAIPGATAATYVLSEVPAGAAGTYDVVVSNSAGTVTSPGAVLTLRESRLMNVAVRSAAGTGEQTLIVGFRIDGTGTKRLLLRGVGPTLAQLNVLGALADPQLKLFNGAGVQTNQNDDWESGEELVAASARVGAFALPAGSKDAALLLSLPVGANTAHVTSTAGTGVALIEAYDADQAAATGRIINVSARTQVGTGENILIAGFVIDGTAPKTVLIRAVGPGLVPLGVSASGVLADPQLRLFSGAGQVLQENNDWGGGTELLNSFARVGAFALPAATSKDAALLVTLAPGGYTAQVSGVGNTTGVALIEVYEVP